MRCLAQMYWCSSCMQSKSPQLQHTLMHPRGGADQEITCESRQD